MTRPSSPSSQWRFSFVVIGCLIAVVRGESGTCLHIQAVNDGYLELKVNIGSGMVTKASRAFVTNNIVFNECHPQIQAFSLRGTNEDGIEVDITMSHDYAPQYWQEFGCSGCQTFNPKPFGTASRVNVDLDFGGDVPERSNCINGVLCTFYPVTDRIEAEVEDLSLGGTGYIYGFTDGNYGYAPGYHVSGGLTGRSGILKRFSLNDFSTVQTLDLTQTDATMKGLLSGFAVGGYGFVVSHSRADSVYSGKVARFGLGGFNNVEILDLEAVDARYTGYYGSFVSGAYGYVVPYIGHHDKQLHGRVVRFDWYSFQPQSVQMLDLAAHDARLVGFTGGFSDGTYGYVMHHSANTGIVARFHLGMFSADAVQILDFAVVQANLRGYHYLFTNGRYGYASPWWASNSYHGRAVRFKLSSFSTQDVKVLDFAQTDPGLVGYIGGCATEFYGFMFPRNHGKVAAFDLESFDQVFSIDLAARESTSLSKFYGAFAANGYAYGLPFEHSDVARLKLVSTTTTTETSTMSASRTSTTNSTTSTLSTTTSTQSSSSSSSTSSSSSRSTSSTTTHTTTSSTSSSSSSSSTSTSSTTLTSTSSTSSSSSSSSTSSSSGTSTSTTSTSSSSTSATKSSTSGTTSNSSSTSHSTSTTSSSTSATVTVTMSTSTASSTSSSSLTATMTSSTATSSSTSSSTGTSSSTTTGSTTTVTEAPANVLAEELEEVVSGSIASLATSSAQRITLATPAGPVTVVDLSSALKAGKAASVATDAGSVVALPAATLKSLPPGSLLAVLDLEPPSNSSSDPFNGLGPLAARTLEISLRKASGHVVSAAFDEPLLFRLPGSYRAPADAQCAYLEVSWFGARWSRKGVRRATDAEVEERGQTPGGVWCLTEHLSIFSALLQPILGCTNIELLTAEGLRAMTGNDGWYRAESAGIVFLVWSLLALVVLAGIVREQWASRLGRTHDTGKNVSLCRKFMTLGPQVLKHKYTVFVVYAKDVLGCLTTRKQKLKRASLTATVQRFLALRSGVAIPCVTAHCWDGGRWIDSKASLPFTVLCCKLDFHAEMAERIIREDLGADGVVGALRRFALTAMAVHPLLDAMRVGGGSMTATKRTALQVAGICGVLATNALIFNYSGGLRSWEAEANCFIEPTSQLFVVVATLVSMLVNAVPNAFLADVAKQVHGRPFWNLAFWLWTLAYLALAAFFILLALANLNAKDVGKWYSALEWGLAFKLLGMPMAQALRHAFLLEAFLREDRRCPPTECFRVVLGLSHPREAQLSAEAQARAESMSKKAISAGELLQFAALLGDKAMPDFDSATSTSDDVMRGAIEPLCLEPPSLEDFPVLVEVLEVSGLVTTAERLSCSVLHLGKLAEHERPCLSEQRSRAAAVEQGRCALGMKTFVTQLLPEQALALSVGEEGGESLGIAWLSAEELLAEGGWRGELRLHATEEETRPIQAASVPSLELSGSGGRCSVSGRNGAAKVVVAVTMPEGYHKALAMQDCQRARLPQVEAVETEFAVRLSAEDFGQEEIEEGFKSTTTKAFCKARSYKQESLPPAKMVVHSRLGRFLHLVVSVLADALGTEDAYKVVEAKMAERDFSGVLEMLRLTGTEGTRYWIEMFAVNPLEQQRGAGQGGWHESFLASWPTMLRAMRRASCRKLISDIEGRKVQSVEDPFQQLLVLDEDFHFLHEMGCLSELMLARAMQLKQRLVLHPSHLKGAGLGQELRRLAEELTGAYNEYQGHYTAPYVEDKQAVFDTVRGLIVASVKEHREDEDETWEELDMGNIAAAVAAVRAQRSEPHDVHGDGAQMEGQVDMDVDV